MTIIKSIIAIMSLAFWLMVCYFVWGVMTAPTPSVTANDIVNIEPQVQVDAEKEFSHCLDEMTTKDELDNFLAATVDTDKPTDAEVYIYHRASDCTGKTVNQIKEFVASSERTDSFRNKWEQSMLKIEKATLGDDNETNEK